MEGEREKETEVSLAGLQREGDGELLRKEELGQFLLLSQSLATIKINRLICLSYNLCV